MESQNKPYVLGVSAYFHDSAAALVHGNSIVAAAQEERFTRLKADWRFPDKSIAYCLANLPENATIDALAFYENPVRKIDRILQNAVTNAPRGAGIWRATLKGIKKQAYTLPRKLLRIMPDAERIHFIPHHRSHAASCFYPSPFEDAAVLVVDGVGEWATASIWRGRGAEIDLLHETHWPHSLGMLYSAFTQYCGFKVNMGEYKLMGLAPYGRPLFRKLIRDKLIDLNEDGSFQLNLDYFSFHTDKSTISPLFTELFRYPVRKPFEPISMHYMNVAASIQAVFNDVMVSLAEHALKKSGHSNLCMAGGVALNCVANSQIALHVKGLTGIWVQPAAGDAGGALGAALDVARSLGGEWKKKQNGFDGMANAYLGPEFSPMQVVAALERHQLEYLDYSNNEDGFRELVSQELQRGQIVGYFDGRMEFGPRALGNRSILADPRPNNMLQRANNKIKFRETWRPLAPIVLAEHEDSVFDKPMSDPYMLFISMLKQSFRKEPSLETMRARGLSEVQQYLNKIPSEFPAVTHFDYSARTQALTAEANPRLHAILSHFYEETGCPLLLNTSFNVRGEPIICSPDDAVSAFLNTHLDLLAIFPYVVKRSAQADNIKHFIGRRKFRED